MCPSVSDHRQTNRGVHIAKDRATAFRIGGWQFEPWLYLSHSPFSTTAAATRVEFPLNVCRLHKRIIRAQPNQNRIVPIVSWFCRSSVVCAFRTAMMVSGLLVHRNLTRKTHDQCACPVSDCTQLLWEWGLVVNWNLTVSPGSRRCSMCWNCLTLIELKNEWINNRACKPPVG